MVKSLTLYFIGSRPAQQERKLTLQHRWVAPAKDKLVFDCGENVTNELINRVSSKQFSAASLTCTESWGPHKKAAGQRPGGVSCPTKDNQPLVMWLII
jgi:hypothetical protein